MKIFCYAARSLARSAAVMAGVKPLTSPPFFLRDFDPLWLTGRQLIFFKLHGVAGQPYWYGDGMATAISAQQISSVRLAEGALVFVASCYGGPDAPMVRALLGAGAAAVVTGTGPNYAGKNKLEGADKGGMGRGQPADDGRTAGGDRNAAGGHRQRVGERQPTAR